MLVKVETAQWRQGHRGSTEELELERVCVRRYRREDTQVWRVRRKEIGRRAKKEEHSLCANTLTLDRHVDSVLRRRYHPQNV